MALWNRIQQLEPVYRQKVHELYDRDEFPMEVRHYLAPWIESQTWDHAAQDQNQAVLLFQVLLENLDNQYSRFVQEGREESFLLQCNFRRFKHNFQRYQEEPTTLASIILWFLRKEKEILDTVELSQQVQTLQVQQTSMDTDHQRNLQRRVEDIQNKVQVMDHTIKCLEEQQDEFDFKYQTHQMEGTIHEADKILQQMLNRLDHSRKSLLLALRELLTLVEEVTSLFVEEELVGWSRRQQKACIGAPEDTSLLVLEEWMTALAQALFQVKSFLMKLDELSGKVTYEKDPVLAHNLYLKQRTDNLLTRLLKSAFVVESQPTMPQGKGPLVLRTGIQFSVKTRLLVKIPELNHEMKVTVTVDKEAPQFKGYRRFNILGTNTKALNMTESMNGGFVADFRHLTLREKKFGAGGRSSTDLSLSVTEELHIINFETEFKLHDLSVKLETCSLPVVIISNSSQQQSAWASVLWFNMLCNDAKNVLFFAGSVQAPWSQLAEMLSWQFLSVAGRGLDADQLDMIANKLFGKQQSFESCYLSWPKFNKESVAENNFTFWVWFDGILGLVKTFLAEIWKDGSVIGFVSKAREKSLLKRKQDGTFLVRFSESFKDGGVTFSWAETDANGRVRVRSVQPFTRTDLTQIPFVEIIRNFQILEVGNVPENPLRFLYPGIPKDSAFGKYYTEKSGEQSPYFKYIKTKLMFVSKDPNSFP
ncbi:signal transducer and activator of transcription 2 isoform X2 [Denticeps clupeoides]|uniref:signal transducer and activator of transcription 2 isoform X2 n=1 Tax=Denticeps clupeoides TaxID=299321 RepID=UPI0010A4404B|nr:signal transducer and activator of transcription 3-like isoform X2 [Denticeps clupeoides]